MAMVYLDSCVLIYALDEDPQFGAPARAALAELRQQHLQPVISALVRLECLVQPMAKADSERLHRTHSFLQLFPVLAIQDSTFELATELRARHRLRTPDALHLATALRHGCTSLITNDRRLSHATDDLTVHCLTAPELTPNAPDSGNPGR